MKSAGVAGRRARHEFAVAEVQHRVLFHDLDPMEVVWHGHYTRFFESARQEVLGSISYDYPEMRESGYSWPIVDLQIRFVRPARMRQLLRVRAAIVEWEHRLRIHYLVLDADSGECLVRGETLQVAVDMRSGELCYVSPPVLGKKLGVLP